MAVSLITCVRKERSGVYVRLAFDRLGMNAKFTLSPEDQDIRQAPRARWRVGGGPGTDVLSTSKGAGPCARPGSGQFQLAAHTSVVRQASFMWRPSG